MLGHCKKPLMFHQEMLDLAKELLFRRDEHLESMINIEQYMDIS